jgi:predicted branched-subunit amino acid permease
MRSNQRELKPKLQAMRLRAYQSREKITQAHMIAACYPAARIRPQVLPRMRKKKKARAAYWSLNGMAHGARLLLPLTPGMAAFGIAVGSTTAAKGFSFADMLLMNAVVYAGMSQMVAMEIWPDTLTFGSIGALAVIAATVNARMLLLGAAMRPWLGSLPAWQTYPMLHLLTDPGWLLAMRYRREGGSDAGIYLGGALFFLAAWMAAVSLGYFLGSFIANPRAIGLDLVMPVFFAAMLVPIWHGPSSLVPWLMAGVVSLAFYFFVPGWWYVVAGALAGSIAGGFTDDE